MVTHLPTGCHSWYRLPKKGRLRCGIVQRQEPVA